MITCHCNIITEAEIEQTIIALLDEDRWQLIVPAKVYHALEQRGKCCRCFPNVVDIIIRTSDAYHARIDTPDAERLTYREKLLRLRSELFRRAGRQSICGHPRRLIRRQFLPEPVCAVLPCAAVAWVPNLCRSGAT